jgi:hypothetical protein
MAVRDLQIFIQERFRAFDENMDITPGSPADTQVIQPILRRLGTDPFSVDLAVFLNDRIKQAFPELASDEGDAITDLLIKPATLLWDPFVREVFRIRGSLSFKDPTTLTTEEAEALGANLFSNRERGDFARGITRVYFAQPRTVTITPSNFFTSKTGLHYFPDGKQDITVDEMLLNVEGSLYYFDVNCIAEAAGVSYNIGPNEILNVANLEGTAKVTNLRRFRTGQDEETAVDFVDRTEQELTERSMVTLRGIGARIPKAFPEVTRLAVVGFGDPEMQRDVLRGGGLGAVLAGGMQGSTAVDGTGRPTTRRFTVLDAGVDFTALVDPLSPGSFVLTVFHAFAGPPLVRDLRVSRVLAPDTVEVEDQVLAPFYTGRPWSLRKEELTLSSIPGGILFPDSAEGTVTIPDNEVHVGGLYDASVRGSDFDEASLVIENLTDAAPAASGVDLEHTGAGLVTLNDLVLGTTYAIDDETYIALSEAKQFGFTLQILDGPNAGNYRVLNVLQVTASSPILTLDTATPVVAGSFRWRLVDIIDVDLTDPKDTRVSGADLQSVQHTDVLSTAGSVDFSALGVSVGDTVRIFDGLDAGDFTVKALPAFNSVQVDRDLTASASGLNYSIFKPNTTGGIQLPLVRITKIELLDTSGQPVGSTIPYARPVDIQSRAFENPGRGVKVDVTDAVLGIVSQPTPLGNFIIGGLTLNITFDSHITGYPTVSFAFTAGNKTAAQAVAEINAAASGFLGPNTVLAVVVPDAAGDRVGIVPLDPLTRVLSGTAMTGLFGDTQARTSSDIRSAAVDGLGGWSSVSPAINQDDLDVAQALDGNQIGFYGNLHFGSTFFGDSANTALLSGAVPIRDELASFAPEVRRHLQVGARSIGSARCYFLEPTSIEFNRTSFFSATLADGSLVRYFPDPTLDSLKIPAAPSTVLPKDGQSTGGGTTFSSISQDFILSGIVPGDELVIKYVPIAGTVALADPVVNLALKSVVLSLDGGADQTVILASDLMGFPTDVSRAGVAAQINSAVGKTIARINGSNQIEFESDVSIIVRSTGSANTLLGLNTATDTNNTAAHAGTYSIIFVSTTTLTISSDKPFPASMPALEQQEGFEIRRPSTQRISSTQMSANTAEAGLYYFDVELVSEGTGDHFNISSDQQLTAEGYRSDGYYLSNDNPNLTFSMTEKPTLHISRSILEVGTADSPANATQITGQNIEVTYERATIVSDVQSFMLGETERVVCSNPLARHLIPHFVRFDFEYVGGSSAALVTTDMENYIRSLFPSDFLEVSDLNGIAYQRGATSVVNPVDLIAIVHNYDRTVQAQRSQNALNTGRLAAFVADVLNINRRSG